MAEWPQVMIVGTSGVICGCLANELTRIEGLRVVPLCRDLDDAAADVASQSPDLVVLDHYQDGAAVYRLTGELTKQEPPIRVLVIGAEVLFHAARIAEAGGTGYVWIRQSLAGLARDVKETVGGKTVVPDQEATREMFKRTSELGRAESHLSEQDLNILRRVDRGLTNQEIAKELGCSFHTVKNSMSRIMKSLGVPNRSDAARIAVTEGLIEPHGKKDTAKDSALQVPGRKGTPPGKTAAA